MPDTRASPLYAPGKGASGVLSFSKWRWMDAQLKNYLSQVASLPHEEQADILKLLQDLESATKREESQSDFLKFVR